MRVISGDWRGRPLAAPKGDATRPTADRVRETLFSMLTSRLGSFDGLVIADLFAGSGALGLEALSRGAATCLFVEQDRPALDALNANIAKLDAGDRATVKAGNVLSLGPARAAVDLLLLDPPYGTGAGAVALDKLARLGWIGPATLVSLETGRDEVPDVPALDLIVDRIVGRSRLSLYRLAPDTLD